MEEPPYRAMPLPQAPPREWRPIVERGLAAFNGLIVALLACAFLYDLRARGSEQVRPFVPLFLLPAIVALAACAGFALRGRRVLRATLVLPSAFLWILTAACLAIPVLLARHAPQSPAPGNLALLAAIALLFLSAGILTWDASLAWVRRK